MILLALLLLVAVALVAFAAYVRLAPMDPAAWHADPEAATRTGKPNDYLIGPGGDEESIVTDIEAPALYNRIDNDFGKWPRTTLLVSDPAQGRMTFVQRSKLMGYPDVISVRITPVEGGSRLSVWSRSRFGQSDLGVNKARLETWIAGLSL